MILKTKGKHIIQFQQAFHSRVIFTGKKKKLTTPCFIALTCHVKSCQDSLVGQLRLQLLGCHQKVASINKADIFLVRLQTKQRRGEKGNQGQPGLKGRKPLGIVQFEKADRDRSSYSILKLPFANISGLQTGLSFQLHGCYIGFECDGRIHQLQSTS